jgi:central glycolytic genes regulator
MKALIDIQQRLLPDLLTVMQKRYRILQYIRLTEPIGRRQLSAALNLTERVVRSEVDFLKDQDLLLMTTAGMGLTEDGHHVLIELEEMMKEVSGISKLEEILREKLQMKKVIVVPGDSDTSPFVKEEMGRAAAACLKQYMTPDAVVAVTGGTTLASVANMVTPDPRFKEVLFVPARGGFGEKVEYQANTICAKMAEKAMGAYRLLHVPDQVSEEAYQSIIEDSSVKEILDQIKSASMVIHGLGDAITMAERRRTAPQDMEKILEKKAVAEAFGYYFNQDGKVIHKVKTIGIQLDDLKNAKCVIAVAGGTSKAGAIQAFMKQGHDTIIVTDEGAATELVKG